MAAQGLLNRVFSFGTTRQRGPIPQASPTQELGTSGAYETGGYLVSNERNPKMRGRQRYQEFSDLIANVAIVAAGTRAFLNLIGKASWTVVPAETETEAEATAAQEAADLVKDVINDMERPWSRVVRRAAMFRFYGFSIQEWTAKTRDDGSIGMQDIAPRPAATIDRWALDPAGNVLGMTQRNPKTQVEIFLPRGKVIHLVDDALSDSPEGLGLFRHLIESNLRLRRYQLLEAFGFETDLKGIPVGRAPYGKLAAKVKAGTLSQEQSDALTKPLEDFISKHIKNPELGLALDSTPYRDLGDSQTPSTVLEWDVSLMQGSPTSAGEVAAAIQRITTEMAIVLGVQVLLLGQQGTGSLALGRVMAEQFALMVDSALTEISEGFEADLVPVIMRLNGIDEALTPTLKTEQSQHRDVEQVTQALRDLADSGAPLAPDDPAINAVRTMLGIPEADLEKLLEDAMIRRETAPPQPDPDDPEATADPDDEVTDDAANAQAA